MPITCTFSVSAPIEISIASTESSVTLSISFFLCRSTNSLKCRRKSAPKIDVLTSAMMNVHRKFRRKPKSNLNVFSPYVLIGVLFAANNLQAFSIFVLLL